jgi:hypothetical protein
MHHFRLVPLGSGPALSLAERALEEYGALRIGPREPSTWVWSVEDGLGALEVFSFTHEVPLGFEGFEALVDEIATGMVVDGETTVHGSRSVLPEEWRAVHEEDGRPLERDVLAWAGSVIAQRREEPGASTLFCGLETSLAVGEELGRFVGDTRDFLDHAAPATGSLDAVARLAQLGLRVSVAGSSRTPGELAYLRPLRLTQSVAHAGRSAVSERPGEADWASWLGLLVDSASDVIHDAHLSDLVPPGPDPELVPGYRRRDSGHELEMAARALVTTCVQTLALFGSAHPTFSGTGSR